jgi:hypothetical protein
VSEPLPEYAVAGAGERPDYEPRALRLVAFATASGVAAFGTVGLVAAIIGIYRSYVVFPLGVIAWIGLFVVARPIVTGAGSIERRDRIVAVVGLVFVVGITIWNARHASQHILINRDGGAYSNTARWLALHGNLRITAAVGPFATTPGLGYGSFAMYPNTHSVLSFQFAHLLPALLGQAQLIGGDRLMFAATPMIGGVALLAFFVAAWRLLRNAFVALAALVSFAFLLPVISFSRDSYSEIPLQALVFTALWILADRGTFLRPRAAFVAGIFLGLLQATRIDGLVSLTGVGLLFAIMWIISRGSDRRRAALSAGACALGMIPGVVLGFVDVMLRSAQYIHDLHRNVHSLELASVASILFAVALVVIVPPLASRAPRLPAAVGWIAAGFVAVVGFGAWFVRPHVQKLHTAASPLMKGLQEAANVAVDPRRNYAERTVSWMTWYQGRILVAAAIIGAALLVRELLRGRMVFTLPGIALLAPASAVYLYRPNISTDQIFVMRRFLFSALPLLTLLGFGLVAALLRFVPRSVPRAVPMAIAVAIGAAGVVYPITTVAAVPNITEQRGDLLALKDACHKMGKDAAVALLESGTSLLYTWAPQPLRGWCNVPVAIVPKALPDRAAVLTKLAQQWKAEGRTLWVVAESADPVNKVLPDAQVAETPVVVNPYFLGRRLVSRPRDYVPETFSLALAPVPTAPPAR